MQLYRIVSFKKAQQTPYGDVSDGKWYEYTIDNGINSITGYRCGKSGEVRRYLEEIVVRMNNNLEIKSSRKKPPRYTSLPCFTDEGSLLVT